ncbi:MAG: 50S ribosomal protein L29 [Chloroflexi bacterium]|nr:50S ribosomal protein L29 [Chloroflexota bacterium]
MKIDEIRAKTTEELQKDLEASYREFLNLRFRWETRQLTNVYEIKNVRKTIARLRTVLTERARGIR